MPHRPPPFPPPAPTPLPTPTSAPAFALTLVLQALIALLLPLPAAARCAWLPLPTPAAAGPIADAWRDPARPSTLVAVSHHAALTSSNGGLSWRLHPFSDGLDPTPSPTRPRTLLDPYQDDELRQLEDDLDALLDATLLNDADTLDPDLSNANRTNDPTEDPDPSPLDRPRLPPYITATSHQPDDLTGLFTRIRPTSSPDTQIITTHLEARLLHKGRLTTRFAAPEGARLLSAALIEGHLVMTTSRGTWHGRRAPLKRLTAQAALPGPARPTAIALVALALDTSTATLSRRAPRTPRPDARTSPSPGNQGNRTAGRPPMKIAAGEIQICVPLDVARRRSDALLALKEGWSRERPLALSKPPTDDPTPLVDIDRRLAWRQLAPRVELTLEATALLPLRTTDTTQGPDLPFETLLESRRTDHLQWQIVALWDLAAIVDDPQARQSRQAVEALRRDQAASRRDLARKLTLLRRLTLEAAASHHLMDAQQRAASALQIEALSMSIEASSTPRPTR